MAEDSFALALELQAPPDTVWSHLTDAALLRTWYWPEQLAAEYAFEPTPGGSFRISSEKLGMAVSGEFLEVEAPRHYAKTWRWDGDARVTCVSLSLEPAPDGATLLHLTHSGHTEPEQLEDHRTGWTDCLNRLKAQLDGPVPAPVIRTERDILDAVGRAFEKGGLVLLEDELSPEFFELSSGLLGELFQKFANYRLRLAIVLPDPARHGDRIVELAREHERHASLRFFSDQAGAREWLDG